MVCLSLESQRVADLAGGVSFLCLEGEPGEGKASSGPMVFVFFAFNFFCPVVFLGHFPRLVGRSAASKQEQQQHTWREDGDREMDGANHLARAAATFLPRLPTKRGGARGTGEGREGVRVSEEGEGHEKGVGGQRRKLLACSGDQGGSGKGRGRRPFSLGVGGMGETKNACLGGVCCGG